MHSSTSILLATFALASSAAGTAISPRYVFPRALSGQATFYGGNVAGGACSFSTYTLPSGIFGTALSSSNWDNSAECGACVSVTGPSGNSITAMVVDECPNCGLNHLDLFPTAFTALAPASEGIIDMTWTYVDCPITSPLQLVNKDGVSAFWFSMQVVNANQPVESLEVSTDGGSTWTSTTRQTFNFFENQSGFGTTTVDVRVTSSSGEVVVVNDVEVTSGGSTTASGNFGAGSGASVAATGATSTGAAVVASSPSTSVIVATSLPVSSIVVEAATSSSVSPTSDSEIATISTSDPVETSIPAIDMTSVSTEAVLTSSALPTLPSSSSTSTIISDITVTVTVTVTGIKPGATSTEDECMR